MLFGTDTGGEDRGILTMTHWPDRLAMVTSAGAAIVKDLVMMRYREEERNERWDSCGDSNGGVYY